VRGDEVGVVKFGEVLGDTWFSGDTASGDDGRGAGRECDAGMVTGLGVIERDATAELIEDSVGVGDDTQGRTWGLWRTRVGLGRGMRHISEV